MLTPDPSFAGLVVVAGSQYPIPSRTRPLNSPAPMVLSLKTWQSRSLPGLQRTDSPHHDEAIEPPRPLGQAALFVASTDFTLPWFRGFICGRCDYRRVPVVRP